MFNKVKAWIKDHLIDDAVDWWKLWSVRLNAMGLALLAWIQIDPVSVLGVWNMMPSSLKQVVPTNIFQIVAVILFLLGMLARVVRQPKLEKRYEERKQQHFL